MEWSHSWGDSRSASKEIPQLLWNTISIITSWWPAIGPYPEPDESSLHPPYHLSKIYFNIVLRLRLGSRGTLVGIGTTLRDWSTGVQVPAGVSCLCVPVMTEHSAMKA
jgi:hypothetical protein